MYKSVPLALLVAAVPSVVRAQATPVVEISEGHGHTFTLEGSQARIVKAWPGQFEAFDFGEHPKIPNAKFIFVKLRPGAKLNSTTLTLIIDNGLGQETTQSYVLKRVSGVPRQMTTLIGTQSVFSANSRPGSSLNSSNLFSPPPRPAQRIKKTKKSQRSKKLKVSQEFGRAFASGAAASQADDTSLPLVALEPPKEPIPEVKEAKLPVPVVSKSPEQSPTPPPELFPLIRAPETLQAMAMVETSTPSKKQLIKRSKLDNYAIARYLLRGLYRAERLKQINIRTPQFGQAQDMAIWLRRGHTIEQALNESGLPPMTFDNLLGHGGVGK